jgi:hypothetical protein
MISWDENFLLVYDTTDLLIIASCSTNVVALDPMKNLEKDYGPNVIQTVFSL